LEKTQTYLKNVETAHLNQNPMKYILLSITASILSLANCLSQDIITKKTGEDIQAKVIEVAIDEVKYKKFDNLDGPLFTLLKSDILMIRYQNGTKDIFNESTGNAGTKPRYADMANEGKEDAIANYTGKNSGAGWTAATTIVFSPLAGLIPALVCSSTEPSKKNLNYDDEELMKDNEYKKAYKKQAFKTKKKKIWTNFTIGSGVWLILVLLL
jgi:hypothetical protein